MWAVKKRVIGLPILLARATRATDAQPVRLVVINLAPEVVAYLSLRTCLVHTGYVGACYVRFALSGSLQLVKMMFCEIVQVFVICAFAVLLVAIHI